MSSSQLMLFPRLPRHGDWRCLDCNAHTLEVGEYYMLRNAVWAEANQEGAGCSASGAWKNGSHANSSRTTSPTWSATATRFVTAANAFGGG